VVFVFRLAWKWLPNDGHVGRLRPLLTLRHLKGDPLALLERSKPVAVDGREVDEDVTLAVASGDKPITLLCAKPLHDTFLQGRSSSFVPDWLRYGSYSIMPWGWCLAFLSPMIVSTHCRLARMRPHTRQR